MSGVLSVVEYGNLIDEIAKQIKHENTGKTTINDTELTGCLLWMDDIALIHHDDKELQTMLNITEEITKRYHIKFSEAKSQTITIGKEPPNPFNIGGLVMDHTKAYKYLGVTINNKGNMEEHIKYIKGKTEAALQTIFNLAGNDNFSNMEMKVVWKLVDTCIIPIITYAAEAWMPTKAEMAEMALFISDRPGSMTSGSDIPEGHTDRPPGVEYSERLIGAKRQDDGGTERLCSPTMELERAVIATERF